MTSHISGGGGFSPGHLIRSGYGLPSCVSSGPKVGFSAASRAVVDAAAMAVVADDEPDAAAAAALAAAPMLTPSSGGASGSAASNSMSDADEAAADEKFGPCVAVAGPAVSRMFLSFGRFRSHV